MLMDRESLEVSMARELNFKIRVLLFRDSDMWVAQCLEYDIAAQGKTLDEVQNRLKRTFVGQIILDVEMGKQPLQGIAEAPQMFFERFENCGHRLKEATPFTFDDIPPAYVVNAIAEEAICA